MNLIKHGSDHPSEVELNNMKLILLLEAHDIWPPDILHYWEEAWESTQAICTHFRCAVFGEKVLALLAGFLIASTQ